MGRAVRPRGGACAPHPRGGPLAQPRAARPRGRHRLGDGPHAPSPGAKNGSSRGPGLRLLHRPRAPGRPGRGLSLPDRYGRRGARARPGHPARHRRGRTGLRRDHEPRGGDGRRHGHGLPGGGGPARHGVRAVPSHGPRPSGRPALPHLRGGARRGGAAAGREGRALRERAAAPRPGGPRHRQGEPRGPRAGAPRRHPSRPRTDPDAVPAHPRDLPPLRRRHHGRGGARDPRRPLRDGRRGERPPWPLHPARPVRGGGGGLHRSSRSQSPGQQLPPRGPGVRGPRRVGHGRRRPPRARGSFARRASPGRRFGSCRGLAGARGAGATGAAAAGLGRGGTRPRSRRACDRR